MHESQTGHHDGIVVLTTFSSFNTDSQVGKFQLILQHTFPIVYWISAPGVCNAFFACNLQRSKRCGLVLTPTVMGPRCCVEVGGSGDYPTCLYPYRQIGWHFHRYTVLLTTAGPTNHPGSWSCASSIHDHSIHSALSLTIKDKCEPVPVS
ncbi:hypothetical protein DFH94DRAFT_175593 [Russula ochroleuca]|uniref:Uncharacterized protein n=1 Tax=Russula ochroleuca TaxID=152965 RepID=A0A9P5N4E5_9AGAM|nr:hypothetical protein DFH94DRAFT_175593 [Russula ochroleuca]